MKNFSEQIIKNLEANGFPNKRVSLPTEKLYEIADSKGLSLNKVLDSLKESHNIQSEIGVEKIVFTKHIEHTESPDFNADFFKQAQEMMANMDPEQLAEIQKQVAGMSDSDKEELMKKAKDMGIYK